MSEKPVAIVLGGTFPHGELIKKLKKRGYYTLLIDYFQNPPAAQFADEHSTASAMDYEAVLQIARERDARLVIASCLDQQMNIAIRVAEELNLPHPFSSETAERVTNKKYMKQVMMASGIPTARYYQVDESSDLGTIRLDYPVMVKPTDSCGSAGVQKITDPSELEEAVKKACHFSWTNEAIVEEFKEGIEVSAYTYIRDGKAIVVTTSQRISVMGKDSVKCFSVLNPAMISEKARENVQKISDQIASAFGLVNTPMFFQSIVKGDDVSIIEFSPRLGGGVGQRVLELASDFDMLSASIASYLGEPMEQEPHPTGRGLLMQQLFARDGIFDHVDGVDGLEDCELILLKTPGMEISSEKTSSSKVGVLILQGRDAADVITRLHAIWPNVEVVGANGEGLLIRNLIPGVEDLEVKK